MFVLVGTFAVVLFLKNKDNRFQRPQDDLNLEELPAFPLPKSKINIEEIPEEVEKLETEGVEMKNFYKSSEVANEGGDTIITQSTDYKILYMPNYSYFLISIIGSPFEDVRLQAETIFLNTLGITQEEACKLNVEITTPHFANPEQAGTVYRLSFCQ